MTNDEYRQLVDFLTPQFASIHRQFDALDRRFDAVDRRFDSIDGRFATIDGRLDSGFREAAGWLAKIEGALERLGNVAPLHASIARIEQLLRG